MINSIIVGYSGLAGAGKDEAAQATIQVLEAMQIPSATYSFAFPLKTVCGFIFDMSEEEMTDRVLKEEEGRNTYGMTNRKVMQLVGTESFRDIFNENIWIDCAERNIAKMGAEIVVISDVRFENEAQWVKENGFLFHIDPEGREGFTTTTESNHSSEAGYDTPPTAVIPNKESLGQFHTSVAQQIHGKVLPAYRDIANQAKGLIDELNEQLASVKSEVLNLHNMEL